MEMDCILRLDGWVIFCDIVEIMIKVEVIVKLLYWDIVFNFLEEGFIFLVV